MNSASSPQKIEINPPTTVQVCSGKLVGQKKDASESVLLLLLLWPGDLLAVSGKRREQ